MSPSDDLRVERLLEHASWLRALARRLTGDRATADDLEQRTWLAALEHPPREDRPIQAWLAAVLRNFARQDRRSERRRADHEHGAARAEALPSAGELVVRAAVQRELVEAVLALDEPYREVVLLRYFEGLPPRTIARELGLPLETVHTRLQRGIARLRARLDRGHGDDRRAWIAALLPLAASRPPWLPLPSLPQPSLGALLMNAKILVTATALSAVGLLVAWLAIERPGSPSLASAPATEGASARFDASEAPSAPLSAPPPGTARVAAERVAVADTSTAAALEPARASALHGQVIDVQGRPVAAVMVALEDGPDGPQELATSGADGRFEIPPPAPRGRLVALGPKLATVLAGVPAPNAAGGEIVLVVAPRAEIAGRVLDERGEPLDAVELTVRLPAGFRTRFERVLDSSADLHRSARSNARGEFRFDGVALVESARLAATRDGFEPFDARLEDSLGAGLEVVLARPRARDGIVRGRVIDGLGAPLGRARVAFGVVTRRTEDDGTFAFTIDDPGSLNARFRVVPKTLVAVRKGFQPSRFEAPLVEGKPAWPANVVLELELPALAIEGRVVGSDGEPLPGAKVWVADATLFGEVGRGLAVVESLIAGADEKVWNFARSGGDGRFVIDGLLARDYVVRALDPETLLRGETDPVPAGGPEVELRMPTDALYPRVAGRVVSHAGDPIAGARVFPMCDAFQIHADGQVVSTSHDALDGVVTDANGRFEIKNVPKSLVYLRVEGEDILPLEYGRFAERPDASGKDTPGELPKEKLEALEIKVDRRCHFQVELVDRTSADEVAILDAQYHELVISMFVGNGRSEGRRAPILEGRSHPLAVSDTGKTLVLYKSGVEVGRVPLELKPGELVQARL